jgi:AAA-like domain
VNTIDEAIAVIDAILKPNYLSTVQELVLRQSWLGLNYEQMAETSGYDADYLRTVGSKLWQNLSDSVGERVTKNNFRSVLRQHLSSSGEQPQIGAETFIPEFPDSPVALDSPFYIERPPIEERAREVVLMPGSLLSIKAPQRTGKTSLLVRTLCYAEKHGCRIARINIRQADSVVLQNLERFLRWLCINLARQLQVEPNLEDYWDSELGSKVSCTSYLQDYLLTISEAPLVLGLDEVSHLFEYPEIAREFLPMLRFWHEESRNLAIWQKLHLIISHSTDSYIPLNINQSPFNVGMSFVLPEFQSKQVLELAQRYQLAWQEAEVNQLMDMIGGHPYLVRLALYYLIRDKLSLAEFLQQAPTQSGVYSEHLQSYLVDLREHPELEAAFQKVLLAEAPVQIETIAAYKLYRMGLVRLENDLVAPSCQLLRLYFRDRLTNR